MTDVLAGEPPIIASSSSKVWRLLQVRKSIAGIHLGIIVGQAKPKPVAAEEEAVLGHPDKVAHHMRVEALLAVGPQHSMESVICRWQAEQRASAVCMHMGTRAVAEDKCERNV